MEEEEEVNEVAMKSRYPRRLNFNAPLLSTRRIGGYSGEEVNSQGVLQQAASDHSIPFSWEQAPGKPKESERGDIHDGDDTPRPRLPPCRWHPSIDATNNHDDHQAVINDHHDDSCDGDVDVDVDVDVDDDDDKDAAAFSDAMDVFSLSEAIDIVTKAEKVDEFNGLKLKLAESRGNESPNFIIKRFLPDATALAESSALNFSKSFNKKFPKPCNYPESSASPKGCGLEILFPWRMKHKLCGIKSPVRQDSLNLQPQWRTKQKKHYCSSANVFSNVDKDTRD